MMSASNSPALLPRQARQVLPFVTGLPVLPPALQLPPASPFAQSTVASRQAAVTAAANGHARQYAATALIPAPPATSAGLTMADGSRLLPAAAPVGLKVSACLAPVHQRVVETIVSGDTWTSGG
jgi:hypothetical protein